MKNITLASLIFLTNTIFISEVLAQDGKVYPATICQPSVGPTQSQSIVQYIRYTQHGRVENHYTQERVGVICAIPRENLSHVASIIKVYFDDQNDTQVTPSDPTGNLSCKVRSNDWWGNTYQIAGTDQAYAQTEQYPYGITRKENFAFYLQSVPYNGGASAAASDYGNYTLYCLIPAKKGNKVSAITSITIIEP
jgi:hypothetical protein